MTDAKIEAAPEKKPEKKKKDRALESLRGAAILLIVLVHSLGLGALNEGNADLFYNGFHKSIDNKWATYLFFTFVYIRLPLFTVISGYVYALRPAKPGWILSFLRGKARRIILPLLAVTTITFLLKTLAPGVDNPIALSNWWKIYFFSFDHLWFLQAMSVVFITISLLDGFSLLSTPKRWAGWLVLVILLGYLFPIHTNFWSLSRYPYLLSYFLLGCGLYRFSNQLIQPGLARAVAIFAACSLIVQQGIWFGWINLDVGRTAPIAIAVGVSCTYSLVAFRKVVPGLAFIGYYAYGIYLFHLLAIAVGERVHGLLPGPLAMTPLFLTKVVFAVSLPILAEMVMLKSKPLRYVFLGLK